MRDTTAGPSRVKQRTTIRKRAPVTRQNDAEQQVDMLRHELLPEHPAEPPAVVEDWKAAQQRRSAPAPVLAPRQNAPLFPDPLPSATSGPLPNPQAAPGVAPSPGNPAPPAPPAPPVADPNLNPLNSSQVLLPSDAAGNQTTSASSAFVLFPSSNVTESVTSSISSTTMSRSTKTYSRPWSYTATPSKTTSGNAASKTTFVPGVLFEMSLGGQSDGHAVYSVPMTFGHDSGYRKRGAKRAPTYQVMNMQVDLGSSDMWVAVKGCQTSDCKNAATLFDTAESLPPDQPIPLEMRYAQGAVSGQLMWEQVTLGSFGIAYQAFVAADNVRDEDLAGGQFQGLLGLALPANSIIEDAVPGTTSSNPDGATFLDNLFGAGASAPSQRMFSLSLERREDARTISSFGVGAIDERLCPQPCALDFMPIVAHANLGRTGYLHWRVPLLGMKAYSFADPTRGTGVSTSVIELGPSLADGAQPHPLAVLDSGGVAILVSDRKYADAIYGSYGISASADGVYRMPCTQQMSFSITLGQNEYPIHPLDMSWPDPDDETICVGAIQVQPSISIHGDFVLGSSFLKNVYSVFKYPDQKRGNWQPTVGLNSLLNSSTASADFHAVRLEHRSLTVVSSQGDPSGVPLPSADGSEAQKRVVSSAIIAASSVVGFFVVAAAAFCAWWFWLRRKMGDKGIVEYKMPLQKQHHKLDNSMSTLRSRKHEEMKRQKSMVDGVSDYDIDSWRSTTAAGSASALASLREEDDDRTIGDAHRQDETVSSHARGSSIHQSLLAAESSPSTPMNDFFPRERPNSLAADARLLERRSSGDNRRLSVDNRDYERRHRSSSHERTKTDSAGIESHRNTATEIPPNLDRRASGSIPQLASSPGAVGRLIDHDSPPGSPTSRSYSNLACLAPPGPTPTARPKSHRTLSSQRSPSVSSNRSPSLVMAGPFPSANRDSLTAMSMAGPFPSSRGSVNDLNEYFPTIPSSTTAVTTTSERTERRRSNSKYSLR